MNRYRLHNPFVAPFKVGDRVKRRYSKGLNNGTVVKIDGDDIHVEWDGLKKYGSFTPGVIKAEELFRHE